MAQFYTDYHLDINLQPMVGEISRSKHIVILNKIPQIIRRLTKQLQQPIKKKTGVIHAMDSTLFKLLT
jgi:hypothetical protein